MIQEVFRKRTQYIGIIFAAAVSLLVDAPASSRAGIIGGVAVGNYIVLYSGSGGNHLAVNNFGNPWNGDIGIAGTGTLQASGPGTLNGDVHFASSNTSQAHINNTTIHGSVIFGDSTVQTIANELHALSSDLGAGAGSGTHLAINTGPNQTVSASDGALVGAYRLFTVDSVKMHNGEDLIIRGDGTHTVVFDVNTPGSAQFHGNILLQDLNGKFYGQAGYSGLSPDQVLFNLLDGDKLDLNNNGNHAHPDNIMYGTFLDPNGEISMVNTRLVGRIFGGGCANMQIVSGDTITLPETSPPEAPAPATLLLGITGLIPCGVAPWFRRGRNRYSAN
jgi:hypothetical protein